MKILFIFTGGTIGSTLSGNTISTDKNKSYALINAYNDLYGIDFEYSVLEPYCELSENNTGETISLLANCVRKNLNGGYDGIVVTHGTDTLQYSSALIGYAVGNRSIPVCIVSANYPIENELSNGLYNLHGAIKFIKNKLGNGVFTIYKNSTTTIAHRSTRLVQSTAFSDEVKSIFNAYYGEFDKDFNFINNPNYFELDDEITPFTTINLTENCNKILWLTEYVGMNFPPISDDVRYILINAYHSGTINTKSTISQEFFKKAKEKNIKVFLLGANSGAIYSSAKEFEKLGIIPIKSISPIAVYIKLWLLQESENVEKLLQYSLCGDVFETNN